MKAVNFFLCFSTFLLGLPVGCNAPENRSTIELAELAFFESNWAATRDYCDQAIEQNADNAKAYLLRGRSWLEEGNVQKAIDNYTVAIRLRPDDAEAYYFRADAFAAIGNRRKAIKDRNDAHFNDANYKKAFLFEPRDDSAQLVSTPVPENAEESTNQEVEEATNGNEFDPFEYHLNLQNVADYAEDDSNSTDDATDASARSIVGRLRERNLSSATPSADSILLPSEQLELPSIPSILPNAKENYADWLDGVKQFEQIYNVPRLSNPGEPSEAGRRLKDQSAILTPNAPTNEQTDQENEKAKKPVGRKLASPYHHRWRLGQDEHGREPSSIGMTRATELRPQVGIQVTGIRSGQNRRRQGSEGTTDDPTGQRPNIALWRQLSRKSQGIRGRETNERQTVDGPAPKTYRREFLLPQSGARTTVPSTTGIHSELTP